MPRAILLGPPRRALEPLREPLGHPRRQLAQAQERAAAHQPAQVGAHRAHRRRDGHVVVVQDDQQPRLLRPGIVHRLIGHAGAHRPVADHGHHVAVLLALQVVRHRHAQAGGDAGAAVRGAERVVLALGPPGEPAQPARLPQGPDPVAPPGQDLVRIGLVPDVPQHPVARRVEDRVQRHRQLHHAQRRTQVAARRADRVHRLGPQLVRHLAQLVRREVPQVGRHRHAVQQRRCGSSRERHAGVHRVLWLPHAAIGPAASSSVRPAAPTA